MNVTGVRVRKTVISSSTDKHLYIRHCLMVLCLMIVLDDVSDADAFLQGGVV